MNLFDNIPTEGFVYKVDTVTNMKERERILPTADNVGLKFSIDITVDVRRIFVLNILH